MNVFDKIRIKLEKMEKYVDELEEMLPADEDTYLEDRTVRRACEKTIELAVEEVIDVLSLLVAHEKLGLPQSEDDVVTLAQKKGILSAQLAGQVKMMKGFRNILVHRYGEVDDHKAFCYLSKDLADFAAIKQALSTYLLSHSQKSRKV